MNSFFLIFKIYFAYFEENLTSVIYFLEYVFYDFVILPNVILQFLLFESIYNCYISHNGVKLDQNPPKSQSYEQGYTNIKIE